MPVVESRRVDSVLHLQLNKPERRNALSRAMLSTLAGELHRVDAAVTGVVISGTGETFSAGADFAEITGTSADIDYDEAVAEVSQAITACPRVVVAALEGPCVGAAVDLAVSCDLRVAGRTSWLQLPAVRLGLLYNPEAVQRMRSRLTDETVRRLLLLAERFDADEALAAGLVSHVVPPGAAVESALELLTGVKSEELEAIAATKDLLNAREGSDCDTAEGFQQRRRALLDSPARRAAVSRAHQTHIHDEN